MKTKSLLWLLIVTFFILILSEQGKIISPFIFGSSYVQWSFLMTLAVLFSFGLFISAYTFFSSRQSRKGSGWICLGFLIMFSTQILVLNIAGYTATRLSNSASRIFSPQDLPKFLNRVLHSPNSSIKTREKVAEATYKFYGVSIPYEAENGTYTLYQPSPKAKAVWSETQKTYKQWEATQRLLQWEIKQFYLDLSVYIGCFFLIFFVGILILLFRKNKSS